MRCGREPGFTAEAVKLLEGHLQGWKRVGAESWELGGFGEFGAAGIPQQRGRASPLSHPFEIQVQGHERREGWQCGPAPGQTGSHRTGLRSSSPCPAPSHPSSPHLAQAGARVRQATPSGQRRAPRDRSPITQSQHPLGEAPCREAPQLPSAQATSRVCLL